MGNVSLWIRALSSLAQRAFARTQDERGASMTEYIIVVALIAAVVVTLVGAFIVKMSAFAGGLTI